MIVRTPNSIKRFEGCLRVKLDPRVPESIDKIVSRGLRVI
jgi:hypothetical protein